MQLRKFLLMSPAGDEGSDNGGSDRGDDVALLEDDAGDSGDDDAAAKAAADDAAAKAAAKAADKTIPKSRFDEAVAKEREKVAQAEARAKELEAKLAERDGGEAAARKVKEAEKEISDLEDALDQAIADGDVAKKQEIRAKLRAKTQEAAQAAAKAEAAYATAVAVEQVRYDAEVRLLEAQHPSINPEHEDFDEELTGELLELKAAYEATGLGSTAALKKAAKYVFKTAPEAAKGDKEGKAEPTDEEKAAAARKAAELKEAAIRRGIAAKDRQPAADADKAGKPSDKRGGAADVTKMSASDIGKLSKEEKARLRGDTL